MSENQSAQKSCTDCKFYDPSGMLCDYNYRSEAILDESRRAKDCAEYTPGVFVDSDEHLLVD